MNKIFVNGCFDVLHVGHIKMLKYAKSLGGELVVAIDSDRRVKDSKGKDRPFNNQKDREFFLRSINYVDDVYIFDTDLDLTNLIKKINPEHMVVGSDWKGKRIIGSEYAKNINFFERIDEYSTTKILQHSSNR